MIGSHGLVMASVFVAALAPLDGDLERPEIHRLGKVKVDDYDGLVHFQDPADDGKSYRVSFSIPKPWETAAIESSRIEIWLLTRGGSALPIVQRPGEGPLIEVGSRGATANAIYFFQRPAEPHELMAVVVAVDGKPTAFQLNPANHDRPPSE